VVLPQPPFWLTSERTRIAATAYSRAGGRGSAFNGGA